MLSNPEQCLFGSGTIDNGLNRSQKTFVVRGPFCRPAGCGACQQSPALNAFDALSPLPPLVYDQTARQALATEPEITLTDLENR